MADGGIDNAVKYRTKKRKRRKRKKKKKKMKTRKVVMGTKMLPSPQPLSPPITAATGATVPPPKPPRLYLKTTQQFEEEEVYCRRRRCMRAAMKQESAASAYVSNSVRHLDSTASTTAPATLAVVRKHHQPHTCKQMDNPVKSFCSTTGKICRPVTGEDANGGDAEILTKTRLTQGCSGLMYACQQGHTEIVVRELRTKPERIRQRDGSNKSVLHYCTGQRDLVAAASIAVAAPELLESADEDGFTPLHLAVIQGNLAMVNLLLANKADVNAVDNEGHSVVHWATVCGEVEALRSVLQAGANVTTPDINGGSPLHYAAQMCGASFEGKLSQATSSKLSLEILGILLSHPQSSVDVQDKDGRQPLLWAASAGSAKAVIALVKAGARVECSDKDGLTSLHCAASRGHTECIDTLISLCGAATDLIDSNGCTALHYAVTLGHADATSRLLDLEADPNRQDRKGRTPAHCGCSKGQFETVKLLKERGANLWLRNAKGDLPVHEAASSGRRELVEWLLEQRPKQVNTTSNDGRSLLHIAAANNYTDMCKILLDFGADINSIYRSSKGLVITPLDCALQKANRSTAKFIQSNGGLPASKLRLSARRANPFHDAATDVVKPLKYAEKEEIHDLSNSKKYVVYLKRSDSDGGADTTNERAGECSCTEHTYTKEHKYSHTCRRHHRKRIHRRRTSSCGEPKDFFKEDSCSDICRSKSNIEIRRRKSRERYANVTTSDDEDDSCENCCYHKKQKQRSKRRITRKSRELKNTDDGDDECNRPADKKIMESRPDNDGLTTILHPSSKGSHSRPQSAKSRKTTAVHERAIISTPSGVEADISAATPVHPLDMTDDEENVAQSEEIVTHVDVHSRPVEDVQSSASLQMTEHEEKVPVVTNEEEFIEDISKEVDQMIVEAATAIAAVAEEDVQKIMAEKHPEEKATIQEESQTEDADTSTVNEPTNEELRDKESAVDGPTNMTESNKKESSSETLTVAEDEPQSTQAETSGSKLAQPSPPIIPSESSAIPTEVQQEEKQDAVAEKDTPNASATKLSPGPPDLIQTPATPLPSPSPTSASTEKASPTQSLTEHESSTGTPSPAPIQNSSPIEVHAMPIALGDVPTPISDEPQPSREQESRRSFTLLPPDSPDDSQTIRKSSFQVLKSDESLELDDQELRDTQVFKIVPDNHSPKSASDAELSSDEGDVDAAAIHDGDGQRFTEHHTVGPPSEAYEYCNGRKRRLKKRIKSGTKTRTGWKPKELPASTRSTCQHHQQSNKDQDSGFEPSPRAMKTKIPSPRNIYTAYIPRKPIYATLDGRSCSSRLEHRKPGDKGACDMSAVTRSIQRNIRRYYMERKLFQHLLQLKSLQIRSSKLNEAVLVKRAVDDYHKSCMALGGETGSTLRRYPYSEYTFKNFELFLYETLKTLQKPGTYSFQNINEVYEEAERRLSPDYNVYEKALQCTTKTHRCLHAAHAYTGIPCAAYIPMMNHHTMPKFGFGSYKKTGVGSFCLPKILTSHNQSCGAKVSLELSHGKSKQLISLPSEKLDSNKRYYVTFTVKQSGGDKQSVGCTGTRGCGGAAAATATSGGHEETGICPAASGGQPNCDRK